MRAPDIIALRTDGGARVPKLLRESTEGRDAGKNVVNRFAVVQVRRGEEVVLLHAESAAAFEEVRDVLHLLEWHLALVNATDGSGLYRVQSLAEQYAVAKGLHELAAEPLTRETLDECLLPGIQSTDRGCKRRWDVRDGERSSFVRNSAVAIM